MIARIVLAVSLVLLVAAPEAWAAGPAPIELVDEGAPPADDDAVAPCAPVPAAARAVAVRPPPFEATALPRPAPARIFRPPRA